MAIHSLTVKQVLSRVRQVFPDASEAYVISLINDALNELGQYSQKSMSAKIDIVADQMFYDLSDSAKDSSNNEMGINKIYRVDIMDDDGDYIQVPRVLDGEPLMFDNSSESAIEEPS
jgi:hypothetical protein|tara:strand:+ start:566 stop:916 length:351 start_codon:yes stop_codon:yes gene_type:complete